MVQRHRGVRLTPLHTTGTNGLRSCRQCSMRHCSIEYQSIKQQHPTQCSPQLHANGPPGHNRAYENYENDECDDIASEFDDLDYRRPNNRGRPMMEGHTSCGSAP